MYFVIGSYVRLGDTTKDPLHSTVVSNPHSDLVLSMNRCDRKLWLHVWQIIHQPEGSLHPDELEPVGSFDYAALGEEFKQDERFRKQARRAQ